MKIVIPTVNGNQSPHCGYYASSTMLEMNEGIKNSELEYKVHEGGNGGNSGEAGNG